MAHYDALRRPPKHGVRIAPHCAGIRKINQNRNTQRRARHARLVFALTPDKVLVHGTPRVQFPEKWNLRAGLRFRILWNGTSRMGNRQFNPRSIRTARTCSFPGRLKRRSATIRVLEEAWNQATSWTSKDQNVCAKPIGRRGPCWQSPKNNRRISGC